MTISRILRAISARYHGSRAAILIVCAQAAVSVAPLRAESGLAFDTLVAVCASCHGRDPDSPVVPSWGRIAGQNRDYLVYALKLYRAGGRRGANAGIMIPYAAVLSDGEIERLAEHYAAMR